jgi:hypothetical protein
MNQTLIDQIAHAVLYEGYMLYPYRPSVKNRQRWTFGGLYPQAYAEANGESDSSFLQTECLVLGDARSTLAVSVRFLHLMARQVGRFADPIREWPRAAEPPCQIVESLQVGDEVYYTWQEAVEQTIDPGDSTLGSLVEQSRHSDFTLASRHDREPLRNSDGAVVAALVREQRRIDGSLEVSVRVCGEGVFRLTIRVVNVTPFVNAPSRARDDALMHSLVSAHTVLGIRDGEFVSLIDPPEHLRALAAECRNVGSWPVLVGAEEEKDTMLAAPIILYDYPRIAPESPGDLFDATEIDEILTLRIMTLTDDEKRTMSAVDPRARALLERTEALARDQLMGLHGAVRELRPVGREQNHG